MTAIYGLDRKIGLDLILHTPGGSITALEGLVTYLRQMFGRDIRAIVPQIAMSAGTMLALTCYEIVMGKHSSLGPIDPQIGGTPAHGIIEEAHRAASEIQANPVMANFWHPILQKYQPTLLGACSKAIQLAESLVTDWLATGMFSDGDDAEAKARAVAKAQAVVSDLGKLQTTLTHDRRISAERIQSLGVRVSRLEDDQELQDIVLSTHHAFTVTLAETTATRIIENQNGIAYMQASKAS